MPKAINWNVFRLPAKGIGKHSFGLRIFTFIIYSLAVWFYSKGETGKEPALLVLEIMPFLCYPFIAHYLLKFHAYNNNRSGYFILLSDAFLLALLTGKLGYSYVLVIVTFTGVLMNSIFFVGFKKVYQVFISYALGLIASYYLLGTDRILLDKFGLAEIIIMVFSYLYYLYSSYMIYIIASKDNDTRKKLKEQNMDFLEGLRYAKYIQKAVLKSEEHESENIPPHFVYFRPKDLVSGDFYWALEKKGKVYVAVGDCTSKNVSGAFLTMLGISFLDQVNAVEEVLRPNIILDRLHEKFVKELSNNEFTKGEGMEIALIKIDLESYELEIASTKLTTYIFRNNDTIEILGTEQSIGNTGELTPYQANKITLQKGDVIYLTTRGYNRELKRVGEFEEDYFKNFLEKYTIGINNVDELKKIFQNHHLNIAKEKGGLMYDCCVIGLSV